MAQVGQPQVQVQAGRDGQAEERRAGQMQMGQQRDEPTGAAARGKPGSRRSSVGTETRTTIADLIAAEFGPAEGEEDEL